MTGSSVENCSCAPHEELKRKSVFLREYATELYASGATTARIEKNLERIAEVWNVKADFTVLPTCIILNLWNDSREHSYSITGRVPSEHINFRTITELSRLSWKIADHSLGVETARRNFRKIVDAPRLNIWLVTLLVGCANASFCELFGGDWISMLIVFVATVEGFALKQFLPKYGVDVRIAIMISSCLSALISCSGFVFGWGSTPEIALGTSVLYFVPGIPFGNAVSDLVSGHYVCCISRFLHALIITFSLSMGLCLAFLILNLKFM